MICCLFYGTFVVYFMEHLLFILWNICCLFNGTFVVYFMEHLLDFAVAMEMPTVHLIYY